MGQGATDPAASVAAHLPVKEVMALLAKGAPELAVTLNGARIGVVRAASLMGRLIDPRNG